MNDLLVLLGIELAIVAIWVGWAYWWDRRKILELGLGAEERKMFPQFWAYLGPVLTSTFFVGWYQIFNGFVVKGIILFVLYILSQTYKEAISEWPGIILWVYTTNDAIQIFRMRHVFVKAYQKFQKESIDNPIDKLISK